MARVERQHLIEKVLCLWYAIHSNERLRAEEECVDAMAKGEVFTEEQHRRKGCGEVVDFRWGVFEFDGVILNAGEENSGFVGPAKALKSEARPECHVGNCAHGHLLEVAFLVRCAGPPHTRICFIACTME